MEELPGGYGGSVHWRGRSTDRRPEVQGRGDHRYPRTGREGIEELAIGGGRKEEKEGRKGPGERLVGWRRTDQRCRGEGRTVEPAVQGRELKRQCGREGVSGRKKRGERRRKGGKGLVGWRPVGPHPTFTNVWHGATLVFADVAFLPRHQWPYLKKKT